VNSDAEFVEQCRRAARQLQRDLAAADAAVARAAAMRLAQLPAFAATSIDELIAARGEVKRADAQAAIALEHGYVSWAALLQASLPLLACVTMHTGRMGFFLNRWFATYEEAAASHRAEGGYLLPYRRQFFVTVRDAVAELGIDPDDPDWARIGYDFVRPRDPEAHLRLLQARFNAMLARGEPLP
jgi:hypothetical protein